MLVRPATLEDHSNIVKLAELAGIGMTSLPPDPDVLEAKIRASEASFAGRPFKPREECFFFVMEDTETKAIVGTAGVVAHVGLSWPFYSYKISTLTQASSVLDVYSHQQVLHMVNDYTGASEIGSLFVHPDYRRDGIGRFLSRCRFLMLAELRHLFDDRVIAEMRGVQDSSQSSPFYEGLAHSFFTVDFQKADYVSATRGNQFIADLMPRYPIYVSLLPPRAREAIGQVHEASRPALNLLQKEGFRFEGYVDVLDGGPTVQAELGRIRTVRESIRAPIKDIVKQVEAGRYILSNTSQSNFRMFLAPLVENTDGSVTLTWEAANHLQVEAGGYVRYVML
jgi:arginine N-succinyltransferase